MCFRQIQVFLSQKLQGAAGGGRASEGAAGASARRPRCLYVVLCRVV
jgi:hypothetical protein